MLLICEIQPLVMASPAPDAVFSDFNWLYNWFSEVSHIWTRFTWLERSQGTVGPWQWEAVFIVRDVGSWALFCCCVDTARHCSLFLFCSLLGKKTKHILFTWCLRALKMPSVLFWAQIQNAQQGNTVCLILRKQVSISCLLKRSMIYWLCRWELVLLINIV